MKRYHLSYADWTLSEYAEIARCLLLAKVRSGKNGAILSARLATLYVPSTVYLTNYGHHAIQIALKIFQRRRPQCNEVIVPAYICPSVIQAIVACGLNPVSVDIGDDLNLSPIAMHAAFNDDTLAVIAPHMYGCPAKIVEIESLCQDANIFLIDDAAQVVGVRCDGRLLGTFGDAGIISFAQSKTIVTGIRGSGGVLLINKPAYDADAMHFWQLLPDAGRRIAPLADFLWNYIWSAYTGNSAYYLERLLDNLGWRRKIKVVYAKMSNLEAGIALVQLSRLETILQEKIRISAAYHTALQGCPLIDLPQFDSGRFLARVMLCLPEKLDMSDFRKKLQDAGLETRAGYLAFSSSGSDVSNAEKLSPRLLGVPCRPGMSDSEIEDICRCLADALQAQPAVS